MAEIGALTGAKVLVGKRMVKSYAVEIQFPPGVDPAVAYANNRTPHIDAPLDIAPGTELTLGYRTTRQGRRGMWVQYSILSPPAYAHLHLTTMDGQSRASMPPPSAF